ncbi:MAG: phosphatase PAP2 family protein [Clostridiales bacterium]|nr:phosphatase PAP2 family protein [Clostridiales bacterium]
MAGWLNTVFHGFDKGMFEFAHLLAEKGGKVTVGFFSFISFLGESGWFLIVLGVIALLFKTTRKVGLAILIGLLFGTLINNSVIKNLVSRPRPYTANSEYFSWYEFVGAPHTGKNSFPSGHSACTMSAVVAFILMSKNKYRFFALLYALVMGFSRIFLIVHYTTDVLAGFVVGAITGTLAYFAVKGIFALLEKYKDKKWINWLLNADIIKLFKKKEN